MRFFILFAFLTSFPAIAEDDRVYIDMSLSNETLSNPMQKQEEEQTQIEAFGIDVLQLQISDMEKIIKEQTNTIEKLNHNMNKMQQQIENLKSENEIRFDEVNKKIETKKAEIAEIEAKKEVKKDQEEPAIDKNIDVKIVYEKGIELIRAGKYEDAQLRFEELLAVNKKHELAGNAKYWLGESYYARNDYANAAVIFAQGFQEYPKSVKAPDNLLKLGISMKALKKTDEACTAFKSVGKEFPKADKKILAKAKNEIEKLKCK